MEEHNVLRDKGNESSCTMYTNFSLKGVINLKRTISRLTESLIVECNQLTTSIPKHLGHKIARVKTCTSRIDSAQLVFVVIDKLNRPFF